MSAAVEIAALRRENARLTRELKETSERARNATALSQIHREERDACANEAVRITRELARLRSVMRSEIANTDHHGNCPMFGTLDDADPRCNCVVGALYRALDGGAS